MAELPDALIGYTGFVGSNLAQHRYYDFMYNSKNIHEIDGKEFGTVVCAGVSATKWLANKDPHTDWLNIVSLVDHLDCIRANRFVLISTVDVYDRFDGVDETYGKDTVGGLQPYGRHRLELERWVVNNFENHAIVRLPALFGPGLKKNVLYDLMHNNQLEKIHPDSKFQWYPVKYLSDDIDYAIICGYELVNLVTEPIATQEIHQRFFPDLEIGSDVGPTQSYDVRSVYAPSSGYYVDAESVMFEMEKYIHEIN